METSPCRWERGSMAWNVSCSNIFVKSEARSRGDWTGSKSDRLTTWAPAHAARKQVRNKISPSPDLNQRAFLAADTCALTFLLRLDTCALRIDIRLNLFYTSSAFKIAKDEVAHSHEYAIHPQT